MSLSHKIDFPLAMDVKVTEDVLTVELKDGRLGVWVGGCPPY